MRFCGSALEMVEQRGVELGEETTVDTEESIGAAKVVRKEGTMKLDLPGWEAAVKAAALLLDPAS